MKSGDYKPNELEMLIKIADRAIGKLLSEKPNGGLIVNKSQENEAKMSYQEAKLCLERLHRRFCKQGAFSIGICKDCRYWDTLAHDTAHWDDFGTCKNSGKTVHRYDSCDKHIEEGEVDV